VRAIAISTDTGPQISAFALEDPRGGQRGQQLAGNYWRSGNPLASIDLTAGRIVCVVRGIGLALGRYCITPTLKANLIGIDVPNDRDIVAPALDAASTPGAARLIDWHIAAVEGAAFIVEPNFAPTS
jgi:hypothetical protein